LTLLTLQPPRSGTRTGCLLLLAACALWSSARAQEIANSAAPLPDAPAPLNAPEPPVQPVKLPRHFQIEFASERSSLPEKLRYGFSTTYSPRVFIEALLIAGYPNLPAPPKQPAAPPDPVTNQSATTYLNLMNAYGDQINVWRQQSDFIVRDHAYRLEVGAATTETRQVLSNLVLPIVLHQRASYEPADIDRPFDSRLTHAALSILVTRGDNGNLEPNYSKLIGTFGAAILGEKAYAPLFMAKGAISTPRFIMKYAGLSLAGDLATNVSHELIRSLERPDLQMYNLHGASRDDSYYPMSIGGKFVYWARSTYDIRNEVVGALVGGIPKIPKQPVEPQDPGQNPDPAQEQMIDEAYVQYGRDLAVWREGIESDVRYHLRRDLAGRAESETQLFLQNFAIPVAAGMDPRYIPLGPGYSGGDRAGYALKTLFVGHTDAGNHFVNLPELGGVVGAAVIANEYYYPQLGAPALASTKVLTATITLNLAADAISNLLKEFPRRRTY
jgi:hypothetical protein